MVTVSMLSRSVWLHMRCIISLHKFLEISMACARTSTFDLLRTSFRCNGRNGKRIVNLGPAPKARGEIIVSSESNDTDFLSMVITAI